MTTAPTTAPDALLDRLRRIDTASLIDAGPELRVLPLDLRPVRRGFRMAGRAVTAAARGDLMSVIAGLAVAGPGHVLVIDAGSDERAVAGELFATEARRRGLSGLVIDGRCRDSAQLATIDLPVFSRGVAPHAFAARAVPVVQVPITVGEVPVSPGELVIGDDDGVLVGSVEMIMDVIEAAEQIQARESRLRKAIEGGASLFDAINLDEHLAALEAGTESRLAFRELPASS